MRILGGHDDGVFHWLSRRVGLTLEPKTHLIWAQDNGKILGAMGFGGMMGRAFGSISIAIGERRAALPLIRAGAQFIFGDARARAGYVSIGANRGKWIAELERIVGFKEIDRVPMGLSVNEDLVTLKVTPESCRIWQSELKKRRRALEAA